MSISGIIPWKRKWKSNFARLICISSRSRTPEIFSRRIVRSLYNRIGDFSPPADIDKIRQVLDVVIDYKSLPYTDEECILSRFMGGYKIVINTKNEPHPKRNRFTCCHEFGHILLEKYFSNIDLGQYDIFFESQNDSREEELLCNEIAAEILMPYEVFQYYAMDKNPSLCEIDYLCEIFDASRSTVIRRLLTSKTWSFDLVYWDFLEHEIRPIETWNPSRNVSNDFLFKIVNESYALRQTALTGKPSREDWAICMVEHFCIETVTKDNKVNKAISLFFNKD